MDHSTVHLEGTTLERNEAESLFQNHNGTALGCPSG